MSKIEIEDTSDNLKSVSCPNCGIANQYSPKAIDAAIDFDAEAAKTNLIIECQSCGYEMHFVPKEV